MKEEKKQKDLSQSVLEKIREEKVMPKPRWAFLLKDCSVWVASALSLIVGSLAFAVIIHIVSNNDWDIYENIDNNIFSFIILTLPYFWIISLVIFVFVIYYNFKHTKKGYKYSLPAIVVVAILGSVVLGVIFYGSGFGHAIDRAFNEKVPVYRKFMDGRGKVWSKPDNGFLGGVVLIVWEDGNFLLKDLRDEEWNIIISEEVREGCVMEVETGNLIKVLGKRIDDKNFEAFLIRSFSGEGPSIPFFHPLPLGGRHSSSPFCAPLR